MPDAGKDAKGITDDRAKYDACHSHKLCKNDGADDVAADLEGVADIVAQLVPIAVNHLFEIEDDDRQQGIDRSEHIVFQRLVAYLPRDTVDAEINVLHKKDSERRYQPDEKADDQSLTEDLVGTLLFHRPDLS